MLKTICHKLWFRAFALTLCFVIPLTEASAYMPTIPVTTLPPAPALDISEIEIPANLGTVQETFRGNSAQSIIFIQDAHSSLVAQENIARLVKYFHETYGIKLLVVEGAAGALPMKRARTFPHQEIRTQVARDYLHRHKLTGAEFFLISENPDIKLFGAERMLRYYFNREQYFRARALGEKLKPVLKTLRVQMRNLESEKLNKNLRSFLATRRRARAEPERLFIFLEELHKHYQERSPHDFSENFPGLAALLDKHLHDFSSVQMLSEMARLEKEIRTLLITTEAERGIVHTIENFELLEKLFNLSLTPQDYALLNARNPDIKNGPYFTPLVSALKIFLSFYTLAERRNKDLAERTERIMKKERARSALTIAGGFHTPGITEAWKEKGLSYVIIQPAIGAVAPADRTHYERAAAQLFRAAFETSKIVLSEIGWLDERAPWGAHDRRAFFSQYEAARGFGALPSRSSGGHDQGGQRADEIRLRFENMMKQIEAFDPARAAGDTDSRQPIDRQSAPFLFQQNRLTVMGLRLLGVGLSLGWLADFVWSSRSKLETLFTVTLLVTLYAFGGLGKRRQLGGADDAVHKAQARLEQFESEARSNFQQSHLVLLLQRLQIAYGRLMEHARQQRDSGALDSPFTNVLSEKIQTLEQEERSLLKPVEEESNKGFGVRVAAGEQNSLRFLFQAVKELRTGLKNDIPFSVFEHPRIDQMDAYVKKISPEELIRFAHGRSERVLRRILVIRSLIPVFGVGKADWRDPIRMYREPPRRAIILDRFKAALRDDHPYALLVKTLWKLELPGASTQMDGHERPLWVDEGGQIAIGRADLIKWLNSRNGNKQGVLRMLEWQHRSPDQLYRYLRDWGSDMSRSVFRGKLNGRSFAPNEVDRIVTFLRSSSPVRNPARIDPLREALLRGEQVVSDVSDEELARVLGTYPTGDLIRALLRRQGFSQKELAAYLGLHERDLSKRVRGWVDFQRGELERTAAFLKNPPPRVVSKIAGEATNGRGDDMVEQIRRGGPDRVSHDALKERLGQKGGGLLLKQLLTIGRLRPIDLAGMLGLSRSAVWRRLSAFVRLSDAEIDKIIPWLTVRWPSAPEGAETASGFGAGRSVLYVKDMRFVEMFLGAMQAQGLFRDTLDIGWRFLLVVDDPTVDLDQLETRVRKALREIFGREAQPRVRAVRKLAKEIRQDWLDPYEVYFFGRRGPLESDLKISTANERVYDRLMYLSLLARSGEAFRQAA